MSQSLSLTSTVTKRADYATRTKMNTRAAAITVRAILDKPEFIVDDVNDFRVRVWKKEELQTFKHGDIADAISFVRAVEPEELLEKIPPTAIKYAVTKKWLVQDSRAGWYYVTTRAASELDLPRKAAGRTINFLKI